MTILSSPKASLRRLFAFLVLGWLCVSVARAEHLPPNGSWLTLKYGEVVDGSVYGHSGRPAGDVLRTLSALAAEQPTKFSLRKKFKDSLRWQIAELQNDLARILHRFFVLPSGATAQRLVESGLTTVPTPARRPGRADRL